MLFDSPEMRELIEQDNQFLANGKADWESRILALANDIIYCQKRLYSTTPEIGIDQAHDNFLEETTQHYTKQLSNLKEQLLRLTDKTIIDRVEYLTNNIKGWEEHELTNEEYPWKHVALSMLRFPDKVIFDYDRCPDCGHLRILIYFYSPECTWAMMCGVGGNMVICPTCKIQAEFNETIRN